MFHSCEIVSQRVFRLRNEALEDFVAVSQLRNEGLGCEMAHVCLRRVSQLQKFSQRVVLGLQNGFAEGAWAAK